MVRDASRALRPVRRADRPGERARRARQHHRGRRALRGRRAARSPARAEGVGYSVYHLPDDGCGRGRDPPRCRRRPAPPPPRPPPDAARQPRAGAAAHGRRALPPRRPARGLALTAPTEARLGARLGWLGALSFASGLPYFFFNETVPVWLAASGMSLAGIGLASGASLPWVLKFALGAAGGPPREPAAVDPDLPGPARRDDRGPRGRRSRAPRRPTGVPCSCSTSPSPRRRTSPSTHTPSRPPTAASWAWPTRSGSARTGARAS